VPVRGIDVPELPGSEPEHRVLLERYMERTGSDVRDVARHGVRPGIVPGDALALQLLACHDLLRSAEPDMVLDAGCFLARAYAGSDLWSEFRQVIRALDDASRDELSRTRPICLSFDDPLFAAGLLLFERGRVDEALECLGALNARSLGGLRSELLAAIASCHHRKRDWDTAVAWYDEASIHYESDIMTSPEKERSKEISRWQMVNAARRDARNGLEHRYQLEWYGAILRVHGCLPIPLLRADAMGWSLERRTQEGYPSCALDGHWVLGRRSGEGPPRDERLSTFALPVFWHWSSGEQVLRLYVAETAAECTLDVAADRIEWSRAEASGESLPEWLERVRGSRRPVWQAVLRSAPAES
jgi:hypothetical protein